MYIIIFSLSIFIGFFAGKVEGSTDSSVPIQFVTANIQPSSYVGGQTDTNLQYSDSITGNDPVKDSASTEEPVGSVKNSSGRIYASSKGKKYYIEGVCDGNISVKNKVYYKSIASAVAAGKSRAAACH